MTKQELKSLIQEGEGYTFRNPRKVYKIKE